MKLKFLPGCWAILLCICDATAQPAGREIVTQPVEWFSLTSTIPVTKGIKAIVEGQFRYARGFEPMQYQARTALEIKLNDHFSIIPLGYVYTWNFKYGDQPAIFENNEHRIWEQVSYKHSIGRFKLDHRLRIEQRFIQFHSMGDDGEVVNDGYVINQNRFRYRFNGKVPIKKTEIESNTYFACFYDEVFFSTGEMVTFDEPDQNRIFGGIGYQLDKFSYQAGLFYQMLIKANGLKQENNVGVQIQFYYNF
ncbi:MAG TPA: DUF2490 domain-containing protein [Cyclobacteriaceae bacterium]|nr:DUF2490 domain-containing protein [Cyclobacteriaceae bacterium]